MKCSNCGNEMVESRAGHLCLSCGHIETLGGASDASIAIGKNGHDQSRAAAASHSAPEAGSKPEPETDSESKLEVPAASDVPEAPPPPIQAAPWEPAPAAADTASPSGPEPNRDDDHKSGTSTPAGDAPETHDAPDAPVAPVMHDAPDANVTGTSAEPTARPSQAPETDAKPSAPEPEPPAAEPPVTPDTRDTVPTASSVAPAAASPVASGAASPVAPLNGKPPLHPATSPQPFRPARAVKLAAVMAAIVLLGAGTSAAGYAYLVAPQNALAQYLHSVSSAKTSTFSATVTTKQAEAEGDMTLKLDGKADVKDQARPKLDVNIDGQAAGQNIAGHVIVADKALYFKLINAAILQKLLPADATNNWYKIDYAAADTNECFASDKAKGNYLDNLAQMQIPVKNTGFLGVASLNGSQTLHYRGAVDTSKLKTAIDKLNTKLSSHCQVEATAEDVKNTAITYEIWHGYGSDRLKVNIVDSAAKANTSFTLDTAGYNQVVAITAPTGAKDASEIINTISSNASASVKGAATQRDAAPASPSPMPSATPAPAGPQAASDPARRAALAAYLAAYKAKAVKGFYPINPPSVSVNVTDPDTGQAYIVQKSAPATIGQIEYRPGGACTGTPVTPGKTGTRYLALYTLLADGQSTACVDNR
jgi:hypothetical protein